MIIIYLSEKILLLHPYIHLRGTGPVDPQIDGVTICISLWTYLSPSTEMLTPFIVMNESLITMHKSLLSSIWPNIVLSKPIWHVFCSWLTSFVLVSAKQISLLPVWPPLVPSGFHLARSCVNQPRKILPSPNWSHPIPLVRSCFPISQHHSKLSDQPVDFQLTVTTPSTWAFNNQPLVPISDLQLSRFRFRLSHFPVIRYSFRSAKFWTSYLPKDTYTRVLLYLYLHRSLVMLPSQLFLEWLSRTIASRLLFRTSSAFCIDS